MFGETEHKESNHDNVEESKRGTHVCLGSIMDGDISSGAVER